MCGITGGFDLGRGAVSEPILREMIHAIAHRGPDGDGVYLDGPVALGHRRLAIIDLSDAARQPMSNEAGDVMVVHNGEIYNFRELRSTLEASGHTFRSHADSEVIVHAYEEWGEACVERFNGMFAFVLYDRRPPLAHGRLFVARDRYGIKPVYYVAPNGLFLFASEIKSLLRHPDVSASLCYPALGEYFTFQNIFTDLTLFDGVRLLPPGCTLTVDATRINPISQRRYWDYRFASQYEGTPDDAARELYDLFQQAVTRQLVSDVPVGAYLSGGIDSGSITAVAARCLGRIRTFTGGFDLSSASGMELGFDERPASEAMANLCKTEHYEMVLHAGDMEHVLPELIWHLEDLRVGQCYPNYYIARLASRFVRVVLSGGGGDELFAGYPWRYYRGLRGSASGYLDAYYEYWQRLIPDQDRRVFFRETVNREVSQHDPRDAFRGVFADADLPFETSEDVVNASLYFESKTFLHGLLVVEDKLSMAHALETRVPFLDNNLVDFAMGLPPRFKLRDLASAPSVDEDEAGKTTRYRAQPTADGKVVLRDAMSRLMPSHVTSRAKQGFAAPDASWFRGESIDYVNRLLRDPKACLNEVLCPTYIARVLDEHTSGQVNHRLMIWSLLSFEWWLRTFLR